MKDGKLKLRRSAQSIGLLAGLFAGLAGVAAPASANTIALDLGNLGGTSQGGTGANCVVPGGASACVFGSNGTVQQATFGAGVPIRFNVTGVTVDAYGFNGSSGAYVTQKQGTFGSSETGLGQSNTSVRPSDPDGEVTNGTYLVLKPVTPGYNIAGVWITSMQGDEGARIYGYNGSLTSFDPSALTGARLLGTMCGGPGTVDCSPVGETTNAANPAVEPLLASPGVSPSAPSGSALGFHPIYNSLIQTYSAIVIATFGTGTGSDTPDVAVSSLILSNQVVVPEPASLTLCGSGLFALALLRRHRGGPPRKPG